MPAHDLNAAPIVELLSLEYGQDGCQMEVGLTGSGGFKKHLISLDEYTYLHMKALGPFEGQRVRLSLYTRWDPFRHAYFSTLVKINPTISETLYFACSESYGELLVQLATQGLPSPGQSAGCKQESVIPAAAVAAASAPAGKDGKPAPKKREWAVLRSRPVLLRSLVFGLLLALLLLRMDGSSLALISGSAEAKPDIPRAAAGSAAEKSVPVPSKPRVSAAPEVSGVYAASATPELSGMPEASLASGAAGGADISAAAAAAADASAATAISAAAGVLNAPADSDALGAANAPNTAGAAAAADVQLAALQNGQPERSPAPEDQGAQSGLPKPEPLYETIELSGDSYEYSLPEGYVALSFDDGPSRYTEQLVDILVKEGVAANFLFIGQNVSHYSDAVSYAAGHGMPVGNHSWDHSDLTKNSLEENRNNLAMASQSLEKLTAEPVTIFRPPYGAVNKQLAEEAGRQQLKVLLWNRDPEDWKADSPEKIVNYFHKTKPSGGIYLLHEKSITVEALPEIIAYLKETGLKFAIFK